MKTEGLFDTQALLFDRPKLSKKPYRLNVPEHYYKHGWAILDDVSSEFEAVELTQNFIDRIDSSKLPLNKQFNSRIQLAKADHIPVCDDIVATSYQVLHFDMGHPFVASKNQLLITHVGIYLPKTTGHKLTARTRVVELDRLLKHSGLTAKESEDKVVDYVKQYGDGWSNINTLRLACFARFLDALNANPELQDQRDKTVGQWFQNEEKLDETTAYNNEAKFYSKHGIDLGKVEKQLELNPGQLLILDNTRVIHGRIGKRKAKELFNFMFGLDEASDKDIDLLRASICNLLI